MGPIAFTFSGQVPAAIERVYDLLTDPTRIPEWLPRCTAVKAVNERKGKGAKFHITYGRDISEIEIIDYQPPFTYGWLEHYRRSGSKTFFGLEFQGGATRIRMKHIWKPAGFGSWLLGRWHRRRNAHRMFDSLLQNLRKVLTR